MDVGKVQFVYIHVVVWSNGSQLFLEQSSHCKVNFECSSSSVF